MTVDGQAIRDRLPSLTESAMLLADQLRAEMSDAEYGAVAVAIVRATARAQSREAR